MKNIIKSLFLSLFMVFTLLLSSCFSSFTGSSSLSIASITTDELENGDIKVTITYDDMYSEPKTFIIPKGNEGEQGKEGVGIKDISFGQSEDNLYSTITITYTDDSKQQEVYTFPNGVSVSGVDTSVDEQTGNTILVLNYTNGLSSDPIVLSKGIDGNGIASFDYEYNDNNGNTTLKFTFTDNPDVVEEITIPQGKQGNGIDYIVSSESLDKYILTITYTDGTNETVSFDKPTQWHKGNGSPAQYLGKDGDFYYDIANNVIYTKEDQTWKEQIVFENNTLKYSVTFDLNADGDATASLNNGNHSSTYSINANSYFTSSGYSIPVPTRDGYTFVGWYRTRDELSPINGAFTDLTIVTQDLNLYAHWAINE